MKRVAIANLLRFSGVLPLVRRFRPWNGVVGLNYHRVGNDWDSPYDHGVWSASAESFDAQIAWLKKRFDLICPRDLPDALRSKRGRYILITFDDGYRDNYELALPVLRRHGVPATFFITTGYLDTGRLSWWDEVAWMIRTSPRTQLDLSPWQAERIVFQTANRGHAVQSVLKLYKPLCRSAKLDFLDELSRRTESGRIPPDVARDLWMTWDMVREMHRAGMEIGGHTVNHPMLANLERAEQSKEIEGSVARIAEEVGRRPRSFSYPNGGRRDFNEDTRACLTEAAIEFAFSYYGGYRTFADWDPLDIRRLSVSRETSLPIFQCTATLPSLFGREMV
jgi:peptidoglycan/xylan/chitin deacetylase (PgdA/CDA1 family)